MIIRTLFTVCITFNALFCPATASHAALPQADKVLVFKSKRWMVLLNNGRILRSYRVALGRKPTGQKVRRGDGRTPEGRYTLDRRNDRSRFYRSIHISYPNLSDVEKAKKKGVSPGEGITIHGLPSGFEDLGDVHTRRNWTRGCIAVSNREMDEIWAMVPDGTPIEIRP